MPSYNSAEFISESIKSVQAQTYNNWELLIIDDCSTDQTISIINSFMQLDNRIFLIKNTTNRGAAFSRNEGLKKAIGEWIAFLDSDDLWNEAKLCKQINFMLSNNYSFSYTNYSEISENGAPTGRVFTGPKRIGKFLMNSYNFMGCLTVMYNQKSIGEICINDDIKKANDYAMWLKVIKKADAYLLDEVLAEYRFRLSGSITSRNKGIIPIIKRYYNLHVLRGTNIYSAFVLSLINIIFAVVKRLLYVKQTRG